MQKAREGLWFGVVELLELERAEEKARANGLSAYKAQLEAMKNTAYQATINITRCEKDFIEYIELDFEVVGEVRKLGSDFYNAFRALWLTQYLISIQELDQDYRELMMSDFSDEDWDNMSEMSGVAGQGQLVNSEGLQ